MKPNPVAFKMAPAEMMQQETQTYQRHTQGGSAMAVAIKSCHLIQEGAGSVHPQQEHSSRRRGAWHAHSTTCPERERERGREGGRLGCSPNHMAASIMNCMRDQPHEANGSSPVDQFYAPLHLHQEKFIHSSPTITSRNAEKQLNER